MLPEPAMRLLTGRPLGRLGLAQPDLAAGQLASLVEGAQVAEGDELDDDAAQHYAQRTLLKLEVLPEHVADAVIALVGGGLSRTTGAFVPVDSGVPSAFPR